MHFFKLKDFSGYYNTSGGRTISNRACLRGSRNESVSCTGVGIHQATQCPPPLHSIFILVMSRYPGCHDCPAINIHDNHRPYFDDL